MDAAAFGSYLEESRALTLDAIREIVPKESRHAGRLYELMLDYPLRQAKALRPALCIATCRALGGRLQPVLRSAAVLELYHNAFLIHDDVEDDSERRRGLDTLHRSHGVPIAVNVGDGMLALALHPLLDNMATIGMGMALKILRTVGEMARVSAEGQAMELEWIRTARFDQADADYVRMVYKKSAWYSFVTPAQVGAIAASADAGRIAALQRYATQLGVAFQIQDDLLNLTADEEEYGKEIDGDLLEGKHTLILLHALRCAAPDDRRRAEAILRKPRPPVGDAPPWPKHALDRLVANGDLTPCGREELEAEGGFGDSGGFKTPEDVAFLRRLIDAHGSLDRARRGALHRARRAGRTLESLAADLKPSIHLDFLRSLVGFVVERTR